MALTINLTQLKRKKKKDRTIPIYIRITEDRKSRYKSTGISVLPKYWNADRQEIRKSHRRNKHLNRKLREQVREIQKNRDELEKNDKLDLHTLKSTISEDADLQSIIHYAREYRKHLNDEDRYWEKRHFKVVIGNIERFIRERKKVTTLTKVDAEWIEDFQDYLLTVGGPLKNGQRNGNSPNTVRKKLQRLKGMFNWLIKNKELKNDPFTTVEKVEANRVNSKTKLTFQQIKSIQDLSLEKGSHHWHVRNYFLYSFYNAGIRFGDLCTLTWDNLIDGRLVYSMHKTGKQKSIKQLEPMQEILDLYRTEEASGSALIFPILDDKYDDPMELRRRISTNNVLTNKRLKIIAAKAGIEANISFHVSRHSFAHYALKKGTDLYSISKALGHSDLKTTQQYLKSFDEEKLDKSMENLFN